MDQFNSKASFEVRLSRFVSLIMLLIGVVFFLMGYELGFGQHVFGPEDIKSDNPIFLWGFIIFCIGVGGLIVLNMMWYIFFPPCLLRADAKGLSFATGFRYNPYLIGWRYVDSVGYGADATLSNLNMGLRVTFKESDQIPWGLVTSAGVSYQMRRLILKRTYMNCSVKEATSQILQIQNQINPSISA